ncbi:hypothetical protein AGMMS4957_21740 [Bacteroidia bacterium]|nr:hypothetical protein AGMMS4957_21740 [Bacteroidia bacterium]
MVISNIGENMTEKWVTISEFEKLTGLKNRTIMAAIKRGGIPEACVSRFDENSKSEVTPLFADLPANEVATKVAKMQPYYINPQETALHWYENLNINRQSSQGLRTDLAKYIATFKEGFNDVLAADVHSSKARRQKDTGDTLTYSLLAEEDMTNAEAIRLQNIPKAKIAELELKEKEGTLVQKGVVYDQLFEYGNQFRNALLAIPDRITDNLIASVGNRSQVLNLIYEAIAAELGKFSDVKIL